MWWQLVNLLVFWVASQRRGQVSPSIVTEMLINLHGDRSSFCPGLLFCPISIFGSRWAACIPYSGKLLREKTFTNFCDFTATRKVFSTKCNLPTDPWKFSPSKVSCYTVDVRTTKISIINMVHDSVPILKSDSVLHTLTWHFTLG